VAGSAPHRPRVPPAPADCAILLAACAAFYWKLTFSGQYTWLAGTDIAYQVLPWFQFQAGEWQAGRLPLWDPYHWFGQPLAGQVAPAAAYPLNWILFLLPLNDGWLRHTYLNWYFVLIHAQGAMFAYWLCRDLKRSRPASILGGLVYALGGFMGSIDWPQMLNGAVWSPLVLLFLLRFLRGERPLRSAGIAGAFLGVSLLSGHHQVPTFLALAGAGAAAWRFFAVPARRLETALASLLLVALGALAGGLQMLPAIEYGRHALRWAGAASPVGWSDTVPYTVHSLYSFPPATLLGIVFPLFQTHTSLYAGAAALALAIGAAWRAWPDAAVRACAVGALLALLLCFGQFTFFHGVLYALAPWVEKARNPSMANSLFHVFFAPLVAFGLDAVLAAGDWLRTLARWLAYLGSALGALVGVLVLAAKGPPEAFGSYLLPALAALALAAVLAGFRRGLLTARATAATVVAIALLELSAPLATAFTHIGNEEAIAPLKGLADYDEIARFLGVQPMPARVDADHTVVPQNMGDWLGVETAGGFLASLTRNVFELESHDDRIKALMGVRYRIAKEPLRLDQISLYEDRQGRKILKNPEAMPRAWVVHEAQSAASAAEAREIMRQGADPGKLAPVAGVVDPALTGCASQGAVRLTTLLPGRLEMIADMPCPGLVVVAQTWFPGWVAAVDGVERPVREVFSALQGVEVDRGAHLVELRYRPRSVLAGALMTAAGLLIAGALAWRR
jgi:hypothetical protein